MKPNHKITRIEGRKIYLRNLVPSDLGAAYLQWLQNPEVTSQLEIRFTATTEENMVDYAVKSLEDPSTLFLAICLKADDRHIGNIKLTEINSPHRRAELGILLGDKTCWGKGLGAEAITLLTQYAFENLDLHKVTAGTYATNLGSIGAFLKAGFKIEARRRQHCLFQGKYTDAILFGKINPLSPANIRSQCNTLGILQARVTSTRLPGKVLKSVLGRPLLLHQIDRINQSTEINALVVATSADPSDDPIEELCRSENIECFRGSLNDVLERFYGAAQMFPAQHIVRLTGDCPVIDPSIIDDLIRFYKKHAFDYASNALRPTFPDGLDAEVFSRSVLTIARNQATLKSEREHVTQYICKHPEIFKLGSFENPQDLSFLRWTVDEPEDLLLIERIYDALYPENPLFSFKDILQHLEQHPELKNLNSHHQRNAGLQKSLNEDVAIPSLLLTDNPI